ncbi:MAG TPA: terminase family protein [Solirubrobacterales bacterium]|nr:terminase family protein [Solirubrobacterales bacterium]
MTSGLVVPDHLKNDPALRAELAELEAVLEANPLQRYNHPLLPKYHAKQMEFNLHQCQPLGIKALIAGNRTGKTMGCRADDTVQVVPREFVPEHLLPCKKWEPPCHIWVGAPKYAKHEDTTLPLFRKLIPKDALWKQSFAKAYSSQSRMLQLDCGSTIGFKTYDQDLDAWASAEVHRISWDEEPNVPHSAELRSEARARLISTGGEEIIGMTPLLGYSWVYDDVWLRRDDPRIHVVTATMEDNPWLPPEVIAEFVAGLTEDEKRMRIRGEFVHVGGLVYPQLKDRHFVDPPKREHLEGQSIYVGIDPGVNTTAVVFVAFDNDNTALVFDELYLHDNDAIPENASKAIYEKLSLWNVEPSRYLIDPSARNRSLTDARRVQDLYKLAGIRTTPAQNDRETGVFEVRRRLEFDQIFFSRDCRHLKWEMERYRQEEKADGRFDVLKEDDHGCDAVRYVCVARPLPIRSPLARPQQVQWEPGTAPPMTARRREAVGPLGRFS